MYDLKRKLMEEHISDFKNWDSSKRETLLSQHKLNIGDIMALKDSQVSSPEEASETEEIPEEPGPAEETVPEKKPSPDTDRPGKPEEQDINFDEF